MRRRFLVVREEVVDVLVLALLDLVDLHGAAQLQVRDQVLDLQVRTRVLGMEGG